ncbi:hypothetical protein LP420_04975 [Massilia sp. B-10]|nr:hypothetical protein LP420_04975 [Massilia sp. B-10]
MNATAASPSSRARTSRFDQRTPPLVAVPQRHWFWGTILEQRPIFRDILASALLINLFGLAMPLFTMNVYDRVVPNFAEATLWVFMRQGS